MNMTASSKTTRAANGKWRRPAPLTAHPGPPFFMHLYLKGHRIAVCVGHLTNGEAKHVLRLGTMIGPRGTDWDLHTHREEIALAREICRDESVFGDPPDWSPGGLANRGEPGVGRVATNCRLGDFAFWLGMHFHRLQGAPPEVDEDGSPKWESRALLVPSIPLLGDARSAS